MEITQGKLIQDSYIDTGLVTITEYRTAMVTSQKITEKDNLKCRDDVNLSQLLTILKA